MREGETSGWERLMRLLLGGYGDIVMIYTLKILPSIGWRRGRADDVTLNLLDSFTAEAPLVLFNRLDRTFILRVLLG